MFEGSCLCGGIQYRLTAEPGAFGYCHCASCRKAGGSGHSANAPIDRSHFHLLAGQDLIREYESSPGKFRAFCSHCGSPMYAYLSAAPDVLRLRLGSLDTPFQRQPVAHENCTSGRRMDCDARGLSRFISAPYTASPSFHLVRR